jgi:hypothetical protein
MCAYMYMYTQKNIDKMRIFCYIHRYTHIRHDAIQCKYACVCVCTIFVCAYIHENALTKTRTKLACRQAQTHAYIHTYIHTCIHSHIHNMQRSDIGGIYRMCFFAKSTVREASLSPPSPDSAASGSLADRCVTIKVVAPGMCIRLCVHVLA